MKSEKDKLMSVLRTNKVLLNEDVENEIYKCIEDKVNVKNVAALHCSSRIFKLSSLFKSSLCFIERWLPTVASSQEFLELEFISVVKILASNELMIDSEMQVFNAADWWLSHNITERGKYATHVLQKVRLSLISDHALNYLLNKNSSFVEIDKCADIIKEVIKSKNEFHSTIRSTTSRHCKQTNFNVIVCGCEIYDTRNVASDVYTFKATSLNSLSKLPSMKEGRQRSRAVYIKGEVYVFGGKDYEDEPIMTVEKYSIKNNTWENIANMYDDRTNFCACSFMDSVYVIGGYYSRTCIKFNTNNRQWNEVASLNERRDTAACAVYKGRIVVTGGFSTGSLNTVEMYDHIADSWSYMPNMIEGRSDHKSFAIKNKLFAVGSWNKTTCEVFESTCNKFVLLKPLPVSFQRCLLFPAEVISIGSKLVVFDGILRNVLFYDVENNEWTKELFDVNNSLSWFGCVKVPQI